MPYVTLKRFAVYSFMFEIKNNSCVTVNNDFWVTSEAICQNFSRVTWSLVKIIGKLLTQKLLSTVTNILFITYTLFWSTPHTVKSNYRSLVSPLSLKTVFSDLALWRHHSWSVTPREGGGTALWRHIRRSFLHGQIGVKAVFTNE